MTKSTAVVLSVLSAVTTSAFAAGPTAGDLSALTPDMATILTSIGAVAAVLLGVNLAIKGFRIVQSLMGKKA